MLFYLVSHELAFQNMQYFSCYRKIYLGQDPGREPETGRFGKSDPYRNRPDHRAENIIEFSLNPPYSVSVQYRHGALSIVRAHALPRLT
jgi:hypothetical protein